MSSSPSALTPARTAQQTIARPASVATTQPAQRSPRPRGNSIIPRPWVTTGAGYIVPPVLHLGNSAAARIFHLAHTEEPLHRDRAAELTGVSRATVNRNVIALLEAGLLEEREDLTELGAIGRPALPVTIRTDKFAVLGIYIGRWTSSVTLHDVHGKILGGKHLREGLVTATAPGTLLQALEDAALTVLGYRDQRTVLWVGVAVEASVTAEGVVSDIDAGWSDVAVGQHFATGLGLPISLAPHVEAMSAAELWNTSAHHVVESTLYVYARETLGIGQVYNGQVHHTAAGSGTYGHLAAESTTLLDPTGEGTVASAVKDSAVVAAAQAAGLQVETVPEIVALAGDGNQHAKTILRERAVVLGEAIGTLVGLLNPTRVVLGGQAFTDSPETLSLVASVARQQSKGLDIRVTAARGRVQQQAAAAVGLAAIANNPLDIVAQATA